MKNLYLIGGTMGVGKTTVCRQLKEDLPRSVFLDGDWCWDASPFQVTEETKTMVTVVTRPKAIPCRIRRKINTATVVAAP